MKAQRLKQIEEIYYSALEISPEKRDSFFAQRCGEDEELRREVESLLSYVNTSKNFLDTPPESFVAEMFSEEKSSDELVGNQIGHYKIIKLLGKGGMGVVYLAEDSKLERKVALKFLPPEFIENKNRLDRFIREAKSASSLNHPNIIVIHEINEFEGKPFIASEYIEGKTLNEFAKSNSLSLNAALEIAIQIASALEEAHAAGIVHRDIKPENIMVRSNGLVKILDFGIAKWLSPSVANTNLTPANFDNQDKVSANSGDSETADSFQNTLSGMIIGTANYMSPEQELGQQIDARTDIFSFGVVIYGLMMGKFPLEGKTSAKIIGASMREETKPLDNPEIPKKIENIIGKCIRKNKNERYQTIGEVLFDLKNVRQDLTLETQIRQTLSLPEKSETTSPNSKAATEDKTQKTTKEIAENKLTFNKRLAVVFVLLPVLFGVFFIYQYFTAQKQIASIAVMPFVNESGNDNIEYLSDGMTETLIGSLSTIPNLSIKARSTVFTYKGKEISPQIIGQELNVDAVLLGRLTQKDNELKLNLELVDTKTQDVLWTEIYERKIDNLVALQSQIAADVSDKLRLKLTASEQNQIAKTYTTNSEAQQLYLKGRFYWNKRNTKDFEKAIEYFKQAIEKDPNHAQAYAGLADTFVLMPLYGNFRPHEYMPRAKEAALKALEKGGNPAKARASLGRILNSYDFDWKGAENEYKTAIDLNPNYATARLWYAEHLAFRGRTDEALEEISKALELDPFSVTVNRMKGNILGFSKRYDEAIVQLKNAEELFPDNTLVKYNLGDTFAAKEMYAEAVGYYLSAMNSDGENPETIQKLKGAYETGGWNGFWQTYLEIQLELRETLLQKNPTVYIDNENIAYAFAAVKNRERTLEFLNKAYEERDPDLVTIKTSEVYAFLADDPQFKELLKKIGLPE